jgi:O-methyltransferase
MIQLGLRSYIRNRLAHERWRSVYAQLKDFTMITERTFCDNLALAHTVRDISGCIIECGVWRGGMIAGLFRVLGPERDYYLFDSFEGLPPAGPIDGTAAIQYQQDKNSPHYHDNCTAPPDFARRAMEMVGAHRYHLEPGFFIDTLPSFEPEQPVALLRLDADWYDSTMVCLRYLFDRVTTGGIIILDDYYTWDGCSRALHDFLSERKATERVRSTIGGVCFLVKRAQPP